MAGCSFIRGGSATPVDDYADQVAFARVLRRERAICVTLCLEIMYENNTLALCDVRHRDNDDESVIFVK